jgi:malate dehydrogenase (oxaloacetate-decarboxylating)
MTYPEPTSASTATVVETARYGYDLLTEPLFNKGTAFTQEERDQFELNGLLPPNIGSLDDQVARRLVAFRAFSTDMQRYVFLRELQDANETLFYALLTRNLEELMPIVYTPTVGQGCQEFSRIFRKPRGLFLSPPHHDRLRSIFANRRFDAVEAIVVTDGERILGLGDQGAGGMGIPIGKLALYSACGGLNPATTLPIMLDVGTDNPGCLADPLYVGWRHERVRGQAYDDFIEEFIIAVSQRWPHVLLQWEDFAKANATRLLERYRDRLCTFNDDIQGTAAVATGTLLAAINVTGIPLTEQRIVIFGAGSAGCGIAGLLLRAMIAQGADAKTAAKRFYMVDRDGLMLEGTNGIVPFQRPFLQAPDVANGWSRERPDTISLLDVLANAGATALIGVSGQTGAFSEKAVRAMAAHTPRPIIFPLSNPTSQAEATPNDLVAWTNGRVVMGTGSPFAPIMRDNHHFAVDQTNNSYIFPGVGLGVIASRARRISDTMLMAAATALADVSPARADPNANLLPPVSQMREISIRIALAVAAQAAREGLCPEQSDAEREAAVRAKIWTPVYRPFRRLMRRTEDGQGD